VSFEGGYGGELANVCRYSWFHACGVATENDLEPNVVRVRGMSNRLQPHCSYVNRANVSQASRGFVSDSWPFL